MRSARNLSYLFSLIPAMLVISGNILGGWFTLANFVFSLVFLALLETILGSDTANKHSPSRDPFPESILFAHVALHTAAFLSLFYGIYSGQLQGGFVYSAALSTGVEAGSGAVVIAHELIHNIKSSRRFWGKYLLATCGNIYFYVHHLRIHHKLVGFAEDAATARKDESLYRFFVRTISQQTAQAWTSEKSRLSKQKKSAFSISNQIVLNLYVQFAMIALLMLCIGISAVLAYLIYAIVAAFLLEYVNYIEHYGLQRKEGEKVNHTHSWNSDKRVSRYMLIDLSRHADHHFHPAKPYHTLVSTGMSPTLPGGYASMVLPALVPFWWFQIMNRELELRDAHLTDR